MLICGLLLPDALVQAVAERRWRMPADTDRLMAIFGSHATAPCLYTFAGMTSETERWRSERDPETLAQYLGDPDPEAPPGDIIQDKVVFVGDLGPDEPIGLDYRNPDRPPVVVVLPGDSGWREVAPNVETFLALLHS